jgi:hypothetical protein
MARALTLTSEAIGPSNLPIEALSTAEAANDAIPGLTGWWEAPSGIEPVNGWRWRGRHAREWLHPRDNTLPLVVTASHGRNAIQQGYGSAAFTSVDRGALRMPTRDYLSADAFTVVNVFRLGLSGETGGTLGGHLWASEGAATDATPRLIISGTTGKPVFRAGGRAITNPPGDFRDGLWHICVARFDRIAGTINVFVDRGASVSSNTGATTAVAAGSRNPVIGRFVSASSSPFYGQQSAVMTFSTALSTGDRNAVEAYLAGLYGVTLT